MTKCTTLVACIFWYDWSMFCSIQELGVVTRWACAGSKFAQSGVRSETLCVPITFGLHGLCPRESYRLTALLVSNDTPTVGSLTDKSRADIAWKQKPSVAPCLWPTITLLQSLIYLYHYVCVLLESAKTSDFGFTGWKGSAKLVASLLPASIDASPVRGERSLQSGQSCCWVSTRLINRWTSLITWYSIVLVHGLGSHRDRTQTANSSEEPWPRTLLPARCPGARILTSGYDSKVLDSRMVSRNRINNHARNLLHAVVNRRSEDGTADFNFSNFQLLRLTQ